MKTWEIVGLLLVLGGLVFLFARPNNTHYGAQLITTPVEGNVSSFENIQRAIQSIKPVVMG